MFDMIGGNAENKAFQQGRLKFNHIPGGCNVLFMDGHVEWHSYDGYQTTLINYFTTPSLKGDGWTYNVIGWASTGTLYFVKGSIVKTRPAM